MSTLAAAPIEGQDLYEQIGARVHQLMWAQRITQTAMAPRMGIAQSVLGRKLRGTVTWTAKDLVSAAATLGVPVEDLLPGGDDSSPAPESTD